MDPVAPPRGRLFQEDLRTDPFWLLVACSLVNLTTWEAAEPVYRQLRETYVDATGLAAAREEDLHDTLRPLGLWRRRSKSLVRLANAWLQGPPTRAKDVLSLPGCGRYASDSWAIFVDGRTDVAVDDGKLGWYLTKLKEPRQ